MKRARTGAALAGLVIGLGLLAPAAAHATEAPPTPAYRLLLWEVPGGEGSPFDPDQVLVGDVITDTASLDLLDGLTVCGRTYQADLELNDETTAALVAGGILHEPGNPTEHHAYGALGEGVNPWKVWTTPDCVQPPDESTPGSSEVLDCASSQWLITNWHDVVTYTGDRTGYVASAPVRVNDEPTTRPATLIECPPADTPPDECGTATTLACSGDESLIVGGIALASIIAGLAAKLWRRRFA